MFLFSPIANTSVSSEKQDHDQKYLTPDLHNPATIEFTPGRVHAPQRDLSSPLRVFVYPLLSGGRFPGNSPVVMADDMLHALSLAMPSDDAACIQFIVPS